MRIRTLEHADHETMADRWLDALAQSRADLLAILSDLTHEELHARITPSAHSVAEYLWHIANVSLGWTKSVVLGEPISEAEKARFGLTRPGEILKLPPRNGWTNFWTCLPKRWLSWNPFTDTCPTTFLQRRTARSEKKTSRRNGCSTTCWTTKPTTGGKSP